VRRSLFPFAFALSCVVVTACKSSGDGASSAAAPPPGDGVVHVDDDDVYCDPVDSVADDTTPATPSAEPLTQWVDPRIGTGGLGYAVGTTYPGPQTPFGMAKPGPDTSKGGKSESFAHCSGYAYADDTIEGFSLARLHGAGIADYGGIALMPTVGMTAAKAKPRAHGSRFSHDTEIAKPGYYAVTLADTGVRVELTATPHVGIMRYAFPAGADQTVLVDVGHVLSDGLDILDANVTIDPVTHEVSGASHVNGAYSSRYGGVRLFFAARFDRAFSSQGTYVGGAMTDGSLTADGKDAGAYLHFDSSSSTVEVAVGLSFVDVAHARANLVAERAPFDTARAAVESTWATRLGALRIDARNDRDRRIAYTALYHTSLMPTLASDVDGSYRGIDSAVHHADGFRYFTDFSLWDTYRTLHPFLTLLYPDDARELAASLGAMAKDGGFVPRWPLGTGESGGMVGDGGTIMLADAYVKGVRDWDAAGAYAIAKNQALTVKAAGKGGRDEMQDYLSLGYVSKESGGASAGETLEYASADYALGELAAALGQTADADTFHARGKNWQQVYDDASHFFVGRHRDGTMDDPNPIAMGEDFSEGTPWHYNFMVPHDADGLAARMGKDMLIARAEQLFTRTACNAPTPSFLPNPYYWASNEPVLFSGWIFSAVGDQERTARWIRWTTLTHYGDGPDGLPGNDDGGTMSAFYLYASLGLYPIAGTDRYVLGAPLFPHATLAIRGGALTIDAPAASKQHRFPRSVTRNGAAITTIVHHGELANATLSFDLATTPLHAVLPH
jgi:predicted alpha-1,2-mannosidase